MKKFLLSFLLVTLIAGIIKAETASITFSEAGYTNAAEIGKVELAEGLVTLTFEKGSNSNSTKYYTSGAAARMYASNTLTVASQQGYDITGIIITTDTGASYLLKSTTFEPEGTVTQNDGKNITTWTGNAQSIVFTNGTGTSGHSRLKSIEVTYVSAGPVAVYNPEITLMPKNTVSISCATDGATIHYTTDGNDPTTSSPVYTSTFTISQTTTVKALAVKGADKSSIVEKTLSPNTVNSLAEFLSLASASSVTVDAPLTAVYQNGSYLYVVENNTPLLIYGYNMPQYKNGDIIPAGVTGSYNLRYNNPQMAVEVATLGTASAGTEVNPEVTSIEEVSLDMRNRYVVFNDVELNYESATSATMSDADGNTMTVYNNNFKLDLASGRYDIYGFINYFNNTPQLVPVKAESLLETVATPVISPESGEVEEGTVVTVSCATEGATIRYTTDGTVPTSESEVFPASGITLTHALNLTVVAFKDNMNMSAAATAEYTIKGQQPATETETFDFSDPAGLNPAQEDPGTTGTNIQGVTFTSGDATLEVAENTNNTAARLWTLTQDRGIAMRLYVSDKVTILPANGKKIAKVTFVIAQNVTFKPTFITDGGSYSSTSKEWVAGSADGSDRVAFTVSERSDISKILVELTGSTVGIDDITADETTTAPAEYYNLQGMRVNGDRLTPGIYIMRQGSKTSKILVR